MIWILLENSLLHASKAFIGTTGIRSDLTLTITLDIEIGVKKAMLKAAQKKILVATSEKFHGGRMFNFCSADQIDCIVTTHPAPPDSILKKIQEHKIQLIYTDDSDSAGK